MRPSLDEVLDKAAQLQALVPGAVLVGGSALPQPGLRHDAPDGREAIETVIDRGSLSDWRALADAIRHNPWGPAARTAETVLSWGEHYGVDALMRRVIARAREDLTQRGRVDYATQIRAWREQTGMTLREFAQAAGTSAPRLSDYEKAKVAPTTDVLGRLAHVAEISLGTPQRAAA